MCGVCVSECVSVSVCPDIFVCDILFLGAFMGASFRLKFCLNSIYECVGEWVY